MVLDGYELVMIEKTTFVIGVLSFAVAVGMAWVAMRDRNRRPARSVNAFLEDVDCDVPGKARMRVVVVNDGETPIKDVEAGMYYPTRRDDGVEILNGPIVWNYTLHIEPGGRWATDPCEPRDPGRKTPIVVFRDVNGRSWRHATNFGSWPRRMLIPRWVRLNFPGALRRLEWVKDVRNWIKVQLLRLRGGGDPFRLETSGSDYVARPTRTLRAPKASSDRPRATD